MKVRVRRRHVDPDELITQVDQGVATLGDVLMVLEEIRDELRGIREVVDRLDDGDGGAAR